MIKLVKIGNGRRMAGLYTAYVPQSGFNTLIHRRDACNLSGPGVLSCMNSERYVNNTDNEAPWFERVRGSGCR